MVGRVGFSSFNRRSNIVTIPAGTHAHRNNKVNHMASAMQVPEGRTALLQTTAPQSAERHVSTLAALETAAFGVATHDDEASVATLTYILAPT